MDEQNTNPDGSLTRLMRWVAHPFSSDMSALEWLLWLGLIIAASVLWFRMIHNFVPRD
ncbi:MAG: hypothetical protein KGL39_27590 [Patescibacteria group bacterium]|nr:hypothetical protein [Patescibacteria group bacterium]